MSEIKEKVIAAIRNLPDNASYEDIFEILYVQEKITKAKIDSDTGRYITQNQFEEKYKKRLADK